MVVTLLKVILLHRQLFLQDQLLQEKELYHTLKTVLKIAAYHLTINNYTVQIVNNIQSPKLNINYFNFNTTNKSDQIKLQQIINLTYNKNNNNNI